MPVPRASLYGRTSGNTPIVLEPSSNVAVNLEAMAEVKGAAKKMLLAGNFRNPGVCVGNRYNTVSVKLDKSHLNFMVNLSPRHRITSCRSVGITEATQQSFTKLYLQQQQ